WRALARCNRPRRGRCGLFWGSVRPERPTDSPSRRQNRRRFRRNRLAVVPPAVANRRLPGRERRGPERYGSAPRQERVWLRARQRVTRLRRGGGTKEPSRDISARPRRTVRVATTVCEAAECRPP